MESESVLVVCSDSDRSPIGKVGECKDLSIWKSTALCPCISSKVPRKIKQLLPTTAHWNKT